LAGFLLSGFQLALLGAILPAWERESEAPQFAAFGNYFLSLAAGLVFAALVSRRIMGNRGLTFLLVFACVLSCLSLGYLAWAPPEWRAAGLFGLGAGAGLLNTALFLALTGPYRDDPAGTVNRGGIWYGLGCLAATLSVAGTFYVYRIPTILRIMSIAPAIFAAIYARGHHTAEPAGSHPTLRQALKDFRSPGAVLFALLLFFQFGNEWSIAGWLPVFLIHRVAGMSPKAALFLLALYWLILLAGRLVSVAILPRARHGALLFGSGLAAMFGCLLLFFTNNVFGAASGILFIGAGYASIYPLVAEAIGRRFPYYHPGFFNGIFSFALVGGLIAPASLGYAASAMGVGVVIGIPMIGTVTVMALLLLIWLESKITGR
jgi:hypothetical protein